MKPFELHFHIKSVDGQKLCNLLQELTGIKQVVRKKGAVITDEDLLEDAHMLPDTLIVHQSPGWFSIEHNSFCKLYSWANQLSYALNTLFLQVAYRQSDGYSYFLAYKDGVLIREIEATGASETPVVNQGRLFDFENPHADDVSGYDIRMFDRESLVDYCQELGVDLLNLHTSFFSHVLMKSGN